MSINQLKYLANRSYQGRVKTTREEDSIRNLRKQHNDQWLLMSMLTSAKRWRLTDSSNLVLSTIRSAGVVGMNSSSVIHCSV